EGLFDPNADIPDDTPEEGLFDPNADVPDDTPEEGLFDSNDDIPDDRPDENYNPSSSGTITITEQEHEKEPDIEQKSDLEEDPEKEIEIVSPEGERMDPVEPREVLDLRADLESWGYEPEYDPETEPEVESESEPENDVDSKSEVGSEQSSENELENEPEAQLEEIQLITPEGKPILHPEQVPTDLIPIEDAIDKLYEEQQSAEGEAENETKQPEIISEQESEISPERESEFTPEQESDIILDQEPELVPKQKAEQTQKSKRIKAKRLELITDPKALDDYKHYERQHIVKTKYDVFFREKQFKKKEKKVNLQKEKPKKVKDLDLIIDPKKFKHYINYCEQKTVRTQEEKSEGKPEKSNIPTPKKKSKKVKNLELITNHKELEDYINWGDSKTERSQIKKSSEKSEDKSKKSNKQVQKQKPTEIKDLELITKSIKSNKSEEKNESKLDKSSESQDPNKKKLSNIEITNAKSQKQGMLSENTEKQSKLETISKIRLELREKYRRETGRKPIYAKKETKGFLLWLKNQRKFVLKKKQEKVKEIREEWQILLEKWVWEANDSKISKEVKDELIDIIRNYQKFREIYLKLIRILERRSLSNQEHEVMEKLLKELGQINKIQAKIFTNLKAFQSLYNQYHIWDINRILREREKFIGHLIQKLQKLKKDEVDIKKSWMGILKENLFRNTALSLKEKSQIIKIIQNKEIDETNKNKLVSILSNLPTEELISLLGKDFEKHTQNYQRWGWDYDQGLRRIILIKFFKIFKNEGEKSRIKTHIGGNKLNIEMMQKIANNKGGFCLSKIYINNKTKLKWRCKKGHEWYSMPRHILEGTWCPKCYLDKEGWLKQIQEIAKTRGGVCLSKKYINAHSHLKFQCQLGHVWKAKPNSIKNGNWCPHCTQGLSERICRKFFEIIFNKKFPKTKFGWLKNEKGNQMHLDGYNSKLKFGFEYNGKQHYKFIPHWFETRKNFEERKLDDELKKKLCEKHNITLIIVSYNVNFDKMESFIKKKCIEKRIRIPNINKDINWREFDVYSPKKLAELQEIAKSKGGELISNYYYNNRTKLKFRCEKDHEWWAVPYHIKSGSWCPHCYEEYLANYMKRKINELKKIIESKGGEILSPYKNKRSKIKIKCAKGHIWEVLSSDVLSGSWCPHCYHNKEYYLNKIKGIARKRGGICLSNEYKNNKTKLKFCCDKGHEWWARPKSIREGTWCPDCYHKRK
ncbi:MAG: hypothetical protein ACFFG0_31920, partial [Candidatus Thorarchaeota archaeon]